MQPSRNATHPVNHNFYVSVQPSREATVALEHRRRLAGRLHRNMTFAASREGYINEI